MGPLRAAPPRHRDPATRGARMPQEGIGRTVQSAIYRAGAFGHRPAVPTDATQLESAARKSMSRRGFAYVAGSAGSEASAAANTAAFSRWRIVPRMLADTTERDTSVELFGRRHESPPPGRSHRRAVDG